MPSDAGMPSLAAQDQGGGVGQLGREGGPRALRPLHHRPLGPAALGVGPVQLGGDRRGAIAIVGEHQLHARVGPVEASRCVDARGEAEAERTGVDGLRIDGGRGHQGTQPDPSAVAHDPQPFANQAAVLADQGDHVRDGRERHHVQVVVAWVAAATHGLDRPPPRRVAEGDGELVRHAGCAEPLEGVVRDDGVDHRAVGQALPWQVVVGDHDLDPGSAGRRDLLHGTDSTVDGDDEVRAPALKLLDARHRQPVAVGETIGDQPVAARAKRPERRDEDRRRADPVDVVVPMDGDPSPAARSGEDLLADLLHPSELRGLMGLAGLEKATGSVDRPVAAADQGHRDRLGQLELRSEAADLPVVVGVRLKRPCGSRRGHPPNLSSAPDGISGPAAYWRLLGG